MKAALAGLLVILSACPGPASGPSAAEIRMQRQNQIIRALIDLEKPAHTAYDYFPTHTTMQIGVHSQIGVDTLLGDVTL